jgi:hypothetical protein
MTTNTFASRRIDDIERARCLGFDAAYYEASRARVAGDDSASSPLSHMSFVETPAVVVRLSAQPPTLVTAEDDIYTLVHAFVDRGDESDWSAHYYVFEPSLRVDYKDTRPSPDPESSLSGLIDRFRKHPKIGFAERIATRLDYLLEVSREEQPEQAPPSAESLNGFLAFLAKNPGLAYPNLVLTPNGNVRAEWTRSHNEHFAIEFFEDENVRFVIFAPDPNQTYKTSRVSGTATTESVMGLAEYYRVSPWVSVETLQAA